MTLPFRSSIGCRAFSARAPPRPAPPPGSVCSAIPHVPTPTPTRRRQQRPYVSPWAIAAAAVVVTCADLGGGGGGSNSQASPAAARQPGRGFHRPPGGALTQVAKTTRDSLRRPLPGAGERGHALRRLADGLYEDPHRGAHARAGSSRLGAVNFSAPRAASTRGRASSRSWPSRERTTWPATTSRTTALPATGAVEALAQEHQARTAASHHALRQPLAGRGRGGPRAAAHGIRRTTGTRSWAAPAPRPTARAAT